MLRSRIWLVLLSLVLGMALLACSADEPQAEPAGPAAAQAAQQVEEPEPEPEPAQAAADESAEQATAAVEQQTQEQSEAQAVSDSSDQQTEEAAAAEADDQPEEQSSAEEQEQAAAEPEQSEEQDTAASQAEASQEAIAQALEGVRGIVDPSNLGWPREVEGLNGIVSIPAKPMRIITASIGHDEVVLALVPSERLVAVGAVSKDPTFSNISELVLDKAEVSRDPETIIVQSPDIVVTSPWFDAEGVAALGRAGILVIQTALELDPETQINNLLLMGYILGEEERAVAFAQEVQARYQAVLDVTTAKPTGPSVLTLTQYGDSLWTAGSSSTQGSLIVAAGGINAAATAGIEGNQTISLESVIVMAPEIIIIPQPVTFGAEEFRQSLFENEALAEVPAIQNDAVYVVESKHFTTLSHWNIRGAEELARILWPDDFPDPPAASFSLAE